MMKTICCALLWLLTAPLIAIGGGHPIWWWDCNSSDFIVRGQIEYGDEPAFEVKYERKEQRQSTYYIKGKLKISDILYLDPSSRYPDDYKSILRNLKSEHVVLLQAWKRAVYGTKKGFKYAPCFPSSIPQGEAIFALNMQYVFPISDLVLQAVVPRDREDEVVQIIRKRNQQGTNLNILIPIWVLIILILFFLINIWRIKKANNRTIDV